MIEESKTMNENKPIEIGQILYREIGRRNQPYEIKEVKVEKIGKKYFYLEGFDSRYPIDKLTLEYKDKVYSGGFQLYRDKQDILDKNEKQKLLSKLQQYFSWTNSLASKSTLDQLRQVVNILNL